VNVLVVHAPQGKPFGMTNTSLTLVCIDVVTCLIHGQKEGGTLMVWLSNIFHLHAEKKLLIGLRKREYGGRYRVTNRGCSETIPEPVNVPHISIGDTLTGLLNLIEKHNEVCSIVGSK
jgi:hypothetical protein